MKYLSKSITRWLIKRETIKIEDKELYEYAVYSLLLTVEPVVLILIIGGLLGKMIEGVAIIIPFMFIRKFSGGIHAKKLWVCMLSSCALLFLAVWLVDKVDVNTFLSITVVGAAVSLIWLSPVDSENRRLSTAEKKEYKVITFFVAIVFVAIYGVLSYTEFKVYAAGIAEGIILTAMLQIPCMVNRFWIIWKKTKKM